MLAQCNAPGLRRIGNIRQKRNRSVACEKARPVGLPDVQIALDLVAHARSPATPNEFGADIHNTAAAGYARISFVFNLL